MYEGLCFGGEGKKEADQHLSINLQRFLYTLS